MQVQLLFDDHERESECEGERGGNRIQSSNAIWGKTNFVADKTAFFVHLSWNLFRCKCSSLWVDAIFSPRWMFSLSIEMQKNSLFPSNSIWTKVLYLKWREQLNQELRHDKQLHCMKIVFWIVVLASTCSGQALSSPIDDERIQIIIIIPESGVNTGPNAHCKRRKRERVWWLLIPECIFQFIQYNKGAL